MRTVEVDFCGFWKSFDKENNNIIAALRKNFDVKISDTPDFVFYSFWQEEAGPSKKHIKIFYSYEPLSLKGRSFNYFITCRKNFYPPSKKILTYHPIPKKGTYQEQPFSEMLAKRKFCNFVYYNSNIGDNALRRVEFCKELSRYKPIDCPGRVLNNMQNAIEPRTGNWTAGKLEFIRNYKFTIAFENCFLKGYSTEKIYHPLLVKSVPIYSGDPIIKEYYNSKAFINVDDYHSWDKAIEEIIKLDNDDELYLQMVKESDFVVYNDYEKELEDFLQQIVMAGNTEMQRANLINFL